jgi:hypothetical protein
MDEATRQIVYRYPAGPSGSGPFAVWHLGTRDVRYYGPEGTERGWLKLDWPERDEADAAAAKFGEVVSVTESPNLYPAT